MLEKKMCPNSNSGPALAKLFGRDCKNEATKEPHSCPFQEEIWDNDEEGCFCCDDCTYECAMDI